MLQKLGPLEIHKAVKTLVEKNTGLRCYDEVPLDKPSPLYYVELVRTRPDNTKTMWVETYEVWIHAIAEPTQKSGPIYSLIEKLEEAMTEGIKLPEGHDLISQRSNGVQVIKLDESGEKHAVLSFEFKICYGFRAKI